MFNLREFIKRGLLSAVGKMADYQIILTAIGWYEKKLLIEEDLIEINTIIEAQYQMETVDKNVNTINA